MNYSERVTQKVVFGAIFASVAIILKLYISYETQFFAVRIFEIPIIISGILLGPLYGGLVGLVTDIVYSMVNIRGLNVGINLFTLEAMMYGFIPGLMFMLFKYNRLNLAVSTFVTLLTAFLISSTQLYIWQYPQTASFFALLPYRLLIVLIKIPLETILIHFLVTNKGFSTIKIYQSFYKRHNL